MTYDEALRKAAAYCSQAEHCTYEVKEKLNRWEVEEVHQREIIAYLQKENYLSNQRYALAFAKDKFKYNKWGKIRIQLELKRRQLEEDAISNALSALDDDHYLGQAVELARFKLKGLKYKDAYECNGKIFRFLAGKGFETAVIQQAIRKLQIPASDEALDFLSSQ